MFVACLAFLVIIVLLFSMSCCRLFLSMNKVQCMHKQYKHQQTPEQNVEIKKKYERKHTAKSAESWQRIHETVPHKAINVEKTKTK